MSSEPTQPDPLRAAAIWTISLVLPLAMACQLTSADEAVRPPTIGHGSGGSVGHDVGGEPDERTEYRADAPASRRDLAPSTDVALATAGRDATVDRSVSNDLLQIDGIGWSIDSGVAGDTDESCEAGPLCDETEKRKDSWIAAPE